MPATLDFSHLLVDAFLGVLVLCGGFLLGWWLRRVVLAPLSAQPKSSAQSAANRMGEVARGIRVQIDLHRREIAGLLEKMAGDGDREVVSSGLRQLIESNEKLQRELDQAEAKLYEQARTIEDYAARVRIDTLTQVMNRGTFDEELTRRLAEWHRRARPFCVLMLDVDSFKGINDQHGHQAGDEVLQLVAQVLRSTMRDMDVVARYGGDEFAILLPDTQLSEATLAADRLRRRIEGLRVPIDDGAISVTMSIGVAEVLPADDDVAVVRRADEALYAAKETGRNRACYHDGALTATMPLGGTAPSGSRLGALDDAWTNWPGTLHLGLETILGDVRCRVAECERTGSKFSVLHFEIDSDDEDSPTSTELELTAEELVAIGDFLQAALREMDKCVLIQSGEFAAILPTADRIAAESAMHRAAVQLASPDSPLSPGMHCRTRTATFQSGDSAESLLHRLLGHARLGTAAEVPVSPQPLANEVAKR